MPLKINRVAATSSLYYYEVCEINACFYKLLVWPSRKTIINPEKMMTKAPGIKLFIGDSPKISNQEK